MRSTTDRRSLFAVCVLVLLGVAIGCGGSSSPTFPSPSPSTPPVPFSQSDLRVGTGADATTGKTVTVHYTGWLYDTAQPDQKGRQFESRQGAESFSFPLGAGQVIAGWDRGVAGMKVGGLRRLVIPPDLAYGPTGAGNGVIPPNATLIFEVELLNVS